MNSIFVIGRNCESFSIAINCNDGNHHIGNMVVKITFNYFYNESHYV